MKKTLCISLLISLPLIGIERKFPDTMPVRSEETIAKSVKDAERRYQIQLSFDYNRFCLGEDITMDIHLRCREDMLTFTNSQNPFENFKFKLYDELNNPVLPAHAYTLWQHKEAKMDLQGGSEMRLRAGEQYTTSVNLASWFAIERAGRYRIQGSFNPSPALKDNFFITTATAYFTVGPTRDGKISNIAIAAEKKDVIPMLAPAALPPYDVVEAMLAAQQRKEWGEFFRNVHLPSLITITTRYRNYYERRFGPNQESFSELAAGKKWIAANLSNALFSNFNDTTSLLQMKQFMGSSYVDDMANAYRAGEVSKLALAYELAYRTKMPAERAALFDEYRTYLASRYDNDIRFHFSERLAVQAFEKDAEAARAQRTDEKKAAEDAARFYREIRKSIAEENAKDERYELTNYTVFSTTVTNVHGLQTAYVETKLYEKFYNPSTRHRFEPVTLRHYTLKRLGSNWYVVDYSDTIMTR
ncbi:MAG: hypothetical protein HZC28_00685 [Spirochaetes bacterium]|nr:hypothetical protein [Spirochaetota bacterium]